MEITLHWRIPSKKNSKIWTGKILISSKKYREREELAIQNLEAERVPKHEYENIEHIDYKFYMPDNRRTDISNKLESINDMLVKFGLFKDDCWQVIKSFTCTTIEIDRKNPRVELIITLWKTTLETTSAQET